MRFVIYGAGAIGGVIGGRLFQAGHDVTLIARGAHEQAIRDHGLTVASAAATDVLPVPVVGHPADAGLRPGDVVVLAMKSQGTVEAVRRLPTCGWHAPRTASRTSGWRCARSPPSTGSTWSAPRPTSNPASCWPTRRPSA